MRTPRHLGNYPDRDLDLQEALEDGFVALIDAAEKVGWLPLEAYEAIISLAEAYAFADLSDEETADLIDRLKRQGERADCFSPPIRSSVPWKGIIVPAWDLDSVTGTWVNYFLFFIAANASCQHEARQSLQC